MAGGETENEGVPRILWLTSTLHFEPSESKHIKIQYESLYEYSESVS